MRQPLFRRLASLVLARQNCAAHPRNDEWFEKHTDRIEALCAEYLPHGSGFDSRPFLDLDASKPDRLVFASVDFHHMDENGYYDGWSEHTVIVTPSLVHGFEMRITGRDRNDIKDYIAESYHTALSTEVE